MARLHWDIRVSGKVQGVWYRKSAVEKAFHLGITGYAMNLPDGTVRIEAEGELAALETFVAWCKQGPPRAKVEAVDVQEGPLQDFPVFATRY